MWFIADMGTDSRCHQVRILLMSYEQEGHCRSGFILQRVLAREAAGESPHISNILFRRATYVSNPVRYRSFPLRRTVPDILHCLADRSRETRNISIHSSARTVVTAKDFVSQNISSMTLTPICTMIIRTFAITSIADWSDL